MRVGASRNNLCFSAPIAKEISSHGSVGGPNPGTLTPPRASAARDHFFPISLHFLQRRQRSMPSAARDPITTLSVRKQGKNWAQSDQEPGTAIGSRVMRFSGNGAQDSLLASFLLFAPNTISEILAGIFDKSVNRASEVWQRL